MGWNEDNSSGYIPFNVQTVYNIEDYGGGPSKTGSANNTAYSLALTAAIAGGGGVIYFPPSQTAYQFNGPISLSDDVNLLFRDAILDFSNGTLALFQDNACIVGKGTISLISALSVNASRNESQITLPAATTFTNGEIIVLHSTINGSFNNAQNIYKSGEFIRSRSSITNTVIPIVEQLLATHANGTHTYVAATTNVYRFTPIKTELVGGTVICLNNQNISGILIDIGSQVRIKEININNSPYSLIQLQRCFNCSIEKITGYDSSASVSLNYGIKLSNCQDIVVSNSNLIATRHGFDLGGGDFACNVPNRNIIVSSCFISSTGVGNVAGLGMHGNVENIIISDCILPRGGYLAGNLTKYENCTLSSGTNAGEALHATELLSANHIISNCEFNATMAIDPSYGLINIGAGSPNLTLQFGKISINNIKISMNGFSGQGLQIYNNDFPHNNNDIEIDEIISSVNSSVNTETFLSIRSLNGKGWRNISVNEVRLDRMGLKFIETNARRIDISRVRSYSSNSYGIQKTPNATPIWTDELIIVDNCVAIEPAFCPIMISGESQAFSVILINGGTYLDGAQTGTGSVYVDSSLYITQALKGSVRNTTLGDRAPVTQLRLFGVLNVTTFVEDDNDNINIASGLVPEIVGVTTQSTRFMDRGRRREFWTDGPGAPAAPANVIAGDMIRNRNFTTGNQNNRTAFWIYDTNVGALIPFGLDFGGQTINAGAINNGSNATFSIQYFDWGGGFATTRIAVNATGIGFFNTAPAAKPNITGSRGGNAALASLLTGLATLGLITDSTTA